MWGESQLNKIAYCKIPHKFLVPGYQEDIVWIS